MIFIITGRLCDMLSTLWRWYELKQRGRHIYSHFFSLLKEFLIIDYAYGNIEQTQQKFINGMWFLERKKHPSVLLLSVMFVSDINLQHIKWQHQ